MTSGNNDDGIFAFPLLESYDDLEAYARDLVTLYPVIPLSDLHSDLVELRDAVDTALNQRGLGRDLRLHTLAAISYALLGKAAHDLAMPQLAIMRLRTACAHSAQAGDTQLTAWLCGMCALVAYWADSPALAVEHAQAGMAAGATGTTALWLLAGEARAQARLGNQTAADDATLRTQRAMGAVTPHALDSWGGMLSFTAERALYYLADGAAWSSGTSYGATLAEQAVEAYRDPRDPHYAFGDAAGSQCALAIARIRAHDVAGAAEALDPVFSLARTQRINGIMHSMDRVANEISISAGAAGADLLDSIETFAAERLVMQS